MHKAPKVDLDEDRDMQRNPPTVILAGPTAVGKTQLALQVASRVPIEIISADSRQIYRYMDIGTGKPTLEQRAAVPHHLIDIVNPDEVFSAGQFAQKARELTRAIYSRGRVPLVVGGTFLYLNALLFGLFPAPPADERIRNRLLQEAMAQGSERLHRRLMTLDPQVATTIHPNDSVRLIRALEVIEATGRKVSELRRMAARYRAAGPNTRIFALTAPIETIRKRVDARVEQMFEQGFVEEVRRLLSMGYKPSLFSFSSLGYRNVASFIEGKIDLQHAIAATKAQTRRYAKKQLLWMRKDWGFVFLNAENHEANVEQLAGWCKKVLQAGSV